MIVARTLTSLAIAGAMLLPAGPAVPKPSARLPLKIQQFAAQTPIRFEPNVGQSDPEVRYIARGDAYTMLLTANQTVMRLGDSVVRMNLVSGKGGAASNAENLLESVTNYYLGNDPKQWHPAVPNFGRVRFSEVYPGIDIVYYGNQQHLEYDFVVKPGADPEQIRLSFSGADSMKVNSNGDLVLAVAGRELVQRKPSIYQEIGGRRVEVAGRYKIFRQTGEVQFALARYDRARPLVIDPVILYSTYLGWWPYGLGAYAAVTVDSAGFAFITGPTSPSSFLGNISARPYGGLHSDAVAVKYSPTGAIVYATYLGGNSVDGGSGIAVDGGGNIYLSGNTQSTNFPLLNPVQPVFKSGGNTFDGFVTKLDSVGALVYSTYLSGAPTDTITYGIAIDSTGSAFVTGYSFGLPLLNSLPGTRTGAFAVKYGPSGALVFSTFLGNTFGIGTAVAVDGAGSAYFTGTGGNGFLPPDAMETSPSTNKDAWVVKLTSAGSLAYSTYLGGSGGNSPAGIAADSAGYVYVTGYTGGQFSLRNATQEVFGGGNDAFVTKLDPNGLVVYSTYIGGPGVDQAKGIAVDKTGAAYITGIAKEAGFPIVDPIQATSGGGADAFITKLDPDGFLAYSTYLGGNGDETGVAIAVSTDGSVLAAGSAGPNFPTKNAAVSAFSGNDGFLTRISPAASISTARINGVSPSRVRAGSGTTAITISGTGFAPGATVTWNRNPLPGTVSATGATVFVDASFLVGIGTASIVINNPSESPSNPAIVYINNPPNLTRATIGYALSSSGLITNGTVSVDLTNFQTGAVLTWNGYRLNSTPISGGATATVPNSLLQIPGPVNIAAGNLRDADGAPITFANLAVKTITSLSQNTALTGATVSFLVNGTGFTPGDIVKMAASVSAMTSTTFISTTQLRVTANAPTSGVYQVWVETSQAGSSTGSTAAFPSNQVPINVTGTAPCGYTLSSASASFPVAGGAGSVNVATTSACNWTAASPVSWITFTGTPAATGNGTVNFNVSQNTGAASRTAALTIAGQSYLVQQAGSTCTFSLSQASQSFLPAAATGGFNLIAPAGCAWGAASSTSFATVISAATGTGNATIQFSVTDNTTSATRSGSIDVAGLRFAISQSANAAGPGCVVSTAIPPSLATEGLTEPLAEITLNCSGIAAATTATLELRLNTFVTNRLTAGAPDAVLTVNGVTGPPAAVSGSSIQWSGLNLAAGVNTIIIQNVRANASALGATTTIVDGNLDLASTPAITISNKRPVLGIIQPGVLFQRGASVTATGGTQTLVPISFREGAVNTFRPALGAAGGTRLRASITGVPAGVSVYASLYPAQGAGRGQLFSADANGIGGSAVSTTTGVRFSGLLYQQLTPVAGAATATWEVYTADPAQLETLDFSFVLQSGSVVDVTGVGYGGSLGPVNTTGTADNTAPVPRFAGSPALVKQSQLRLSLTPPAAGGTAVAGKPSAREASAAREAAYAPGSNITLVMTLINEATNSADDASNVTIQNNLPPGLTFLSCSAPSGITCSESLGRISLSVGALPAGASRVVTVSAKIDSTVADGTVLNNWAAARSSEINADPAAVIANFGITVVTGSPILPVPADTATGVSLTPTLSWSAVAGVTSYDVYLSTNNLFAAGPIATNLAANSYPTAALTANTTYYWKVIAKAGSARSSEIWSFTTVAAPTLASLTAPTTATITGPSVAFAWGAIAGATGYWLDVGSTSGSGNLCSSTEITALTYTCNNIPTTAGTIYVRLWTKVAGVWQNRDYTFTTTAVATGGVLTTPAPGTQLASTSVAFAWSALTGATAYWLDIGNALGQGDICASGAITTLTYTCSGIPTTPGTTIHAQLWAQVGGVWANKRFTYTAPAATVTPATLTAPVATITAATTTFTWTAGTGIDAYWLDVGTAVGQGSLSSGQLTATTKTVSGLPVTGATIYVRLWSRNAGTGTWLTPIDYTFATSSDPRAKLQSPTATVLPGSAVTFTWSAGAGADAYWLDVGSAVGSGAYSSGQLTALTKTVTGLPCTGAPVYARLWTHIGAAWQTPVDYTFTLASSCSSVATLTAPAAGTIITGTSATFTWTAAAGAGQYWLDIGNAAGLGNISGGAATALTKTVTTLPNDGKPLYVRLWTNIGGVWQTPVDYVFATATVADNRATLTAPTPGSRITGATATFTWTNGGAGVDGYWLDVGTTAGSGNLSSGLQTTTTKTVSNLPNNNGNSTVYVRLWTRISGAWQTPIDYTFTN